MLLLMYKKANQICPSRNIATVSFENEEKVVNPPKNPVTKKSRHSIETLPLSERPNTIPMRKQPIIFTAIVPKGKVERNLF